MRSIVLLLSLACSLHAFSQSKLVTGPEPTWVHKYDYNENPDSSGTYHGYSYRLISVQRNLESQEFYQRYAIKVVSAGGLSSASAINESFDPSYQHLVFHTLKIIREGKTINKLDPSKFELIRREEELSRAIYDKRLNAVYNLPDVRVGDIVEYSFSIKGFNPVFGDHRFGKIYFQYGMPVGKFAHRIIASANRPLTFKTTGIITPFSKTSSGQLNTYEKVVENVPAVLEDDAIPSWYDPYPYIEYSDFNSWNDVKQWAAPLYQQDAKTRKAMKEIIDRILTENETEEARIKACIEIAQGQVRYLSFSDGIHGYKPHSPMTIYDQKYGDCKDKSFLLSSLLNAMGIESYPALVTTDAGYTLNNVLPSPWAFNHCIVQFIRQDSAYWIDPTLNSQVGPLKSYFFPSYYRALVINSKNNELDSIPFAGHSSRIEVLEEYSMDYLGGDGKLKVTTHYTGDEADNMRSYFMRNTKAEVHKNFVDFYSKEYPKISLDGDVTSTDDPDNNIFTCTETYTVNDFWTFDEKDGKKCSVYPRVLSSYLKKPETVQRRMPLHITYPTEVYHTIKIYFPEAINSTDYSTSIESAGFLYRGSSFYNDRTVTLRYHYKAKKSFVSVDESEDHIQKIDQVFADLGYQETDPPRDNTWSSIYSGALILFATMGLIFFLVKRTKK